MLKELEQVFTGAMLRSIAGIVDVGEAILSHFADPDGGPVWEIADDKSDIWVHTQCSTDETPTGRKTSRLFTPGNMLFNLPSDGESALVVRGRDSDGPGQPYALYGDCGAANQVPSWLDDSNAGISHKKTVHLESTQGEIEVKSNATGVSVTLKFNSDGSVTLDCPSTIMIGGTSLTELINGIVLAKGIDPFTGLTYGALGNASTTVMAKP